MKKNIFKLLLVTPLIIPTIFASDDGFSLADIDAAILASMGEAPAQASPRLDARTAVLAAGPHLPKSVLAKLDRSRIQLDALKALGPDLVNAALVNAFTPSDISHINHVLFGVPVPQQFAALQEASEAVVAKMMALQQHPGVGSMKDVVASVLKQINTFGDVHQHDAFCNAHIGKLLQVAKDMGFGKASFQDEVAVQKALGKETDEKNEVLIKFYMLFPKEKVQAEHGVCSVEGDEWIRAAINQAANNHQILSLVAYTVSILDELKGLEGNPTFDTLKYTVLQQIMENYKENGGCLEGVRNRAMKSLAILLNYILN